MLRPERTQTVREMRGAAILWAAAFGAVSWFGYELWRMEGAETAGQAETGPVIALTFDDGPHPVYTPMLLDGLKERGVRATFFLLGNSLEGNEETVRRMAEDGHLIGNHTFSHVQLSKVSVEEALREIEDTGRKIEAITGTAPAYIRPPYGDWTEELEEQLSVEPVFWNVDPMDWKILDAARVTDHVLKNCRDGSIVLLHDSYETTVTAALEIIDTLEKQGYTFVTADELLVD